MRQLVERIARGLVDRPDEVSVEPVEEDGGTLFELRVAQGDLGKVIGKQGRTARALRTLLAAVGRKQGKRFAVEILE